MNQMFDPDAFDSQLTSRRGREPYGRGRFALLSIGLFWLVYFIIATTRNAIADMPAQDEMLIRRVAVTLVSIALTFLLYRVLTRFEGARTGKLLAVAFLASVPLALAYASVNYVAFHVFAISLVESDPMWEHKPAVAIIAGQALDWYFFIATWAVMWIAILYAEKVKRAEQAAAHFARLARDAELRALRYQVNPHFLFNTLNSLSTLVMRGATDEAERMILNLSNFFRESLTREAGDDLPLAEEVRLQRLYLAIEEVRFPDRLRVEVDLPEALGDQPVPALILQPLVENAIKYGVSRSRRPVTVRISARLSDAGRLVLDVADDGEAPAPGAAKPEGCGVGLNNVKARLEARYGHEARLVHGPGPLGGFLARIVMPAAKSASHRPASHRRAQRKAA
jgi:signal transduction histidine kinase